MRVLNAIVIGRIFTQLLKFNFYARNEKETSEDKSQTFISNGDPAKHFLQSLAESKVDDETALKFLAATERYCKQKRYVLPMEFPADHPVEKVGRMLMACLLKHQELGMSCNYAM